MHAYICKRAELFLLAWAHSHAPTYIHTHRSLVRLFARIGEGYVPTALLEMEQA